MDAKSATTDTEPTKKHQAIMPTHRDLLDARKYGLKLMPATRTAVYVAKVIAKKRSEELTQSKVPVFKQTLNDLHKDFGYELLVDFQLKDGSTFTHDELRVMEHAQQIPIIKSMCILEQSPYQSAKKFEKQYESLMQRNKSKNIVPVVEPYTNDSLQKVTIAKKLGIIQFAIKFRSYRQYGTAMKRMLANIRIAEMKSIVFGVMPRRWKTSDATLLLPPLYHQVEMISSGLPWGGGAAEVIFLCEDWIYKEKSKASKGITDYNGKNRLQLVKRTVQYNSALQRIDTINQATAMIRELHLLTKVRFESLFH